MTTSGGQRSASIIASKAASGWHGTYYHTIGLINNMVVNTMATLELISYANEMINQIASQQLN